MSSRSSVYPPGAVVETVMAFSAGVCRALNVCEINKCNEVITVYTFDMETKDMETQAIAA